VLILQALGRNELFDEDTGAAWARAASERSALVV
jgi:hypothetical protein